MKLLFSLLLFLSTAFSFCQLTLSGSYQGSNIYVANPYSDSGFCIDSVYTNGSIQPCITSSSVIEIPLNLKFSIGDSIEIVIYHKSDCKPKVLNLPSNQKANIEIQDVNINDNCVISYLAAAEYRVTFVVEQYRWSKWLVVPKTDTITNKGHFSFNLSSNLHSGENKFRVCAHDIHGKKLCSAQVHYQSPTEKESFNYYKEKNNIIFNSKSRYELFDVYGNLVKKGHSTTIDVSGMKKGAYYLNFGNESKKVVIRPVKK